MKETRWHREILTTGNRAFGDVKRVQGLEIQFFQDGLVGLRGEVLPDELCSLFKRILDEIVSPYLPSIIWLSVSPTLALFLWHAHDLGQFEKQSSHLLWRRHH